MPSKPMNRGLGAAKVAKQDEFYTQYVDIQKEVEAYLEFDKDTFRGRPAADDHRLLEASVPPFWQDQLRPYGA